MADPYPQEQTARDGRDLIAAAIRSMHHMRHAYPSWATGPGTPEASRAAMPSVDGLHGQPPDSLQQHPPVHMYHESHSFTSSYSSTVPNSHTCTYSDAPVTFSSSYSASSSFATLVTAPNPDPAPPPAYVHFHGHAHTSPLASTTQASAASLVIPLPPEPHTPMDMYPPSAPRALPVHDADDKAATRWRRPVFEELVEDGHIACAPGAAPAPALVRTLQLVDQDPLVLVRPPAHEHARERVRVHGHDLAHALDSLARGMAACTDPGASHTSGPRDAPGAAVAAEACAGHVARAAVADEFVGVAKRKDNDGEKDGGVGRMWEHSKHDGQDEDRGRASDDEEAHLGSEDEQEDPDTWFKRVVGSTTYGWNVCRTSDAVQATPKEHAEVRGHAVNDRMCERGDHALDGNDDKQSAEGGQETQQALDHVIMPPAAQESSRGHASQALSDSPCTATPSTATTTTVTLHNLPLSTPTSAYLSLIPSFATAPLDVIPLVGARPGATVRDVQYMFGDVGAAQVFAESAGGKVKQQFGAEATVTVTVDPAMM